MEDLGLQWPILLVSVRGWRVQPGTGPTITQEESREPEEQQKNEWLVGRFPTLPKAKQIQFLFICLLVLAPIPSGSASLLPFQGLPPKAGGSTIHPPPLPP